MLAAAYPPKPLATAKFKDAQLLVGEQPVPVP
jgi:hypothetical protein